MIYYFAYGSNLHPMRLLDRVPSAKLIVATQIDNHRLTFHKRSIDGSSKCDLFKTGEPSDLVHGAIYELAPEHKSTLDTFEGKGVGYIDNEIRLECQGEEYVCFAYLAQPSHIVDSLKPYHWYKEMVVLGAKFLKFPDSYISSIESVESVSDPVPERRHEREVLLQKIKDFG